VEKDLEFLAAQARLELFNFVTRTGKGHLVSALSVMDILVTLYHGGWIRNRNDSVIVSKGHGNIALYPVLAQMGTITFDSLNKYTESDGILRVHADPSIPGVSYVGGSLGNGLGFACGQAIADLNDNTDRRIFVICGDAEMYEGSVWEALIMIGARKLSNITLIIDRNKYGILGATEDLMPLEDLQNKIEAFNVTTYNVDGHDFISLDDELTECCLVFKDTPYCIIADTIKGKGISFMEDDYTWHTKVPTGRLEKLARRELEKAAMVSMEEV
jgi:transketolase